MHPCMRPARARQTPAEPSTRLFGGSPRGRALLEAALARSPYERSSGHPFQNERLTATRMGEPKFDGRGDVGVFNVLKPPTPRTPPFTSRPTARHDPVGRHRLDRVTGPVGQTRIGAPWRFRPATRAADGPFRWERRRLRRADARQGCVRPSLPPAQPEARPRGPGRDGDSPRPSPADLPSPP